VNQILHVCQATTLETTYGQQVSLRLLVPEASREELTGALSGLAGVTWTEPDKN
jgi:hypothetical protein